MNESMTACKKVDCAFLIYLPTFVCILLSFKEESTDRFLFNGTVPAPVPVPVPAPLEITDPASLLSLPSNFFREAGPTSTLIWAGPPVDEDEEEEEGPVEGGVTFVVETPEIPVLEPMGTVVLYSPVWAILD